jgi:hypothetical protein
MCLSQVYLGSRRKKALAKLPSEFVAYKAVGICGVGSYHPLFAHTETRFWLGRRLRARVQTIVDGTGQNYTCGFHAWKALARAKAQADYMLSTRCVLKCLCRKKDVVAIGRLGRSQVIVLSHITFLPKGK